MKWSLYFLLQLLLCLLLTYSSPTIAGNTELTVTQKEYNCLAENIYYEARGEPLIGRIAVAYVVINRANSTPTRSNLCGIIYKPCQFSWTCARKHGTKEEDAWIESKKVAYAILQKGSMIVDPTHGARFYHRVELNPRWTLGFKFAIRFGDHIFYPRSAE